MKDILTMNTMKAGATLGPEWPQQDFGVMIAYREAAAKTTSIPEREYLAVQVARLNSASK